ncbi:glycosyltransferase family 4 protein [Sphingomonas sp. 22L2VL55-3]
MVAWDLARSLHDSGHHVTFLTTQAPSLPNAISVKDGVSIHTLNVPSGRYSRAWWSQSATTFLSHYEGSTDLVLGIGGGAHSILDAIQRLGLKTAIVLQAHGTPWGEIVSKLRIKTLRSLAGALRNIQFLCRDWRLAHYSSIVAIGPVVATALQHPPMSWLVGRTPIRTIENGINEAQFQFNLQDRVRFRERMGIDAGANVVASVSRITLQKGVREALLGFIEFHKTAPNSIYLVAGEGDAEPLLKAIVRQHNLSDNIRFLGKVDRETLPAMFSAADVFLFPSLRQEGLAIAPLEAAASGLKIIISKHISIPEVNALLVIPTNINDIVDKLRKAFADTSSRELTIPRRYTMSYSMALYEECFRQLTLGSSAGVRTAN